MDKSQIFGGVFALSMLGSTAALADWHHHWDDGRDYRYQREAEIRAEQRAEEREAEIRAEERANARAEARANWIRGERFNSPYYSNQYIVEDYNTYNLRRPPQGYRWYRADNQYVLVRRDNGVIDDIIDALR